MAKAATARAEAPNSVKNTSPKVEPGNAKAALEAAGATKTASIHMVPVDQIRVIPGFNVRMSDTPGYADELEELAASIKDEGFYLSHPLSGFAGKDGDADVIYIIDGHRRHAATLKANENGAEVASVPVVLKPKGFTMKEANIAVHRENLHTKLTMAEKAVIVNRLLKMDMTEEDIAKELGITVRAVQDFMVLIRASRVVRKLVREGKVSGTEAVRLLRKYTKTPEKAEEEMLKAVAKAEARGQKKASRKDTSEGTRGGKVAADPGETEGGKRPKLVQRMEEITIKWAISRDQEFPLSDIKRFKALFADTNWYSLITDKEGYAIATEDVQFKASILRPKKETVSEDDPKDPAEDEGEQGDEEEFPDDEAEDGNEPEEDEAEDGDEAEDEPAELETADL